MKPYRLLILTASTGGGHDARADSLAAWAREFYKNDVDVKIFRPLECKDAHVGKFGVELYNVIQRYAPVLHNIYFPIIEIIGDFQGKKFLGRSSYQRLIQSFRPHLIVSLHDFLNKGYFELAHERLGNKVRCVTYCGEYSGGDGFSKHWVCKDSDRWIGRTDKALREAFKYGIKPENMERFTFFLPPDEIKETKIISRKELRLDNNKLTILFATGRNGAGNHLRYLKALEPYKDRVQVIVICGLNERLRRAVDDWKQQTGFQGIVEGYSERMSAYMQVSDVVMFKGGANTATRAFFEASPMWFDASDGVLPQEKLTVDFFIDLNGAEFIANTRDLVLCVERELGSSAKLKSMKNNLKSAKLKYSDPSPEKFFKELFNWGFSRRAYSEELKKVIV